MQKLIGHALALGVLATSTGMGSGVTPPDHSESPLRLSADTIEHQYATLLRKRFDFRQGTRGWEAGFADYRADQQGLALKAGLQDLPPELDVAGTGFYIQGTNRSDDLFMFLKRRLGPEDGVFANQIYAVSFKLVFASNAPSHCLGVGGAPGESVYLKVGASPVEPIPTLVQPDNTYLMNVDKGNQAVGGPAASLVGPIANGIPCEDVPDLEAAPFVSLERRHRHRTPVTANGDGELWLLVGTDSGFEATTALYYQRIDVLLVPVGDGS